MKKTEIICPVCSGDGYQPGEPFCKTCKGIGTITRQQLKEKTDEELRIDKSLELFIKRKLK